MSSQEFKDLFHHFDENGDGYIELPEFQSMCLRLKIDPGLAQDIFNELDQDRDGKINASEFMNSLNEHLTEKRQCAQLAEVDSRCVDFSRKMWEAERAWEKFVERLSPEATEHLRKRYNEFRDLYIEVHTQSQHCESIISFEMVLASLLEELFTAVKEKKLAEEAVRKERQGHAEQLRKLEEELEAHISRVSEMAARDAQSRFREENERIRSELENEIAELRTRVTIMTRMENYWDKDSTSHLELKRQLAAAMQENRKLTASLAETEATLSLVQSESMRMKNRQRYTDRSISCGMEEPRYRHNQQIAESAAIQSGCNSYPNQQTRPYTFSAGDKLPDFRLSPDSAIASLESGARPYSQVTPDSSLLDELVEAKFYGLDEPSIFSEDSLLSYGSAEIKRPLSPDRVFKVVFAGDPAVGKSSFISRLASGVFVPNTQSTIGVDFKTKALDIDERKVSLQLWDTAGQERFRSMTQTYFRRADGVILLFDVTNEKSFLAVRQWVSLVEENIVREVPMVLCGNKVDLRDFAREDGRRCVSSEEGRKLAENSKLTYFETSSKTGAHLMDSLVHLSRGGSKGFGMGGGLQNIRLAKNTAPAGSSNTNLEEAEGAEVMTDDKRIIGVFQREKLPQSRWLFEVKQTDKIHFKFMK